MAVTLMQNGQEALPRVWLLDESRPDVVSMVRNARGMLGMGAFSVVLEVDDFQVLKITTCEASKVLLSTLMGKPQAGLPLVYSDFGQVGLIKAVEGHYDDIPIHAFLMERLVVGEGLQKLRKDESPRGNGLCAKSVADARGAYSWLHLTVRGAAWRDECLMPEDKGQLHPLVTKLGSVLGHTRFAPLVNAVKKMSPRVLAHEWVYDWVERFESNVMLSQWGEPILADPVYARTQAFWKTPYPGL